MDRKRVVERISKILQEVAPDSERILYGSEARGDARDDSDFDILVVIPDDNAIGTYAKRKIEITGCLFDLELEYGVKISPLIVLKSVWERFRTPFTLNVVRDGIAL